MLVLHFHSNVIKNLALLAGFQYDSKIIHKWLLFIGLPCIYIQGGPIKSKPLPNYQKIVFNRIKACQ